MEDPYVVLDLETTGLSAYKDRITEIAAVKMHQGKEVDRFHTLVNPGFPIPRHITRLTGITDEMVKDAPSINQVLPALKSFLHDDIIVAHNAGFDFNFLAHNFLIHLEHELKNKTLCTYKLANRLLDLPRRRLQDVCEYFEVINEQAHRAMGDVEATIKVLAGMVDLLGQSDVSTTEKILAFQNLPRSRAISLLESDD
ncbi:MAG: 3'-5' exonuclease [Nanoarchaeota archaeon]|nr:3'-5' exonuclease [Nanoarchaeota archaeon]